MIRKLPIVGQRATNIETVSPVMTVWVDQLAAISVMGAHVSARADVFVNHLVSALEKSGRVAQVTRASEPAAGMRLLVIVGSHIPRPLRDPSVHALWERADLLLSDPSVIVAEALAAAL